MKIVKYSILALFLLTLGRGYAQQLNNLEQGPYKVGFKTILQADTQGNPLLISLWYPASSVGETMTLKDYITAGTLSKNEADTVSTNSFKKILELPFIYHLEKIPGDEYAKILSIPLKAGKNAAVIDKKFPLVIASSSPDNYPVTFEYLASNGFVVASINGKYGRAPNDSLLYVKATNVLEYLLNYMTSQPYVDASRVAAFGHGWGIQPPFYLAMRTSRVKLLINLDGGVFDNRSKTTLSPDYKPGMLKIPMLQLVTGSQEKENNQQQWKALSNPRYRVVIKSDEVWHHDFTMWGVVVAEGLHKRGPSTKIVEDVYANVHSVMLQFLTNGKLDEAAVNREYFDFLAVD